MIKETKPNQMQIISQPVDKSRWVYGAMVDLNRKKLVVVNVKNYIEYIQEFLHIYKYEVIILNNSRDCIIVGTDDTTGASFTMVGYKKFYGNAIFLRLPVNGSTDKLLSLKELTPSDIFKLINFD